MVKIDPNTASYREMVDWLLLDASNETILYWAECWLRQNTADELSQWVKDALSENE
jgi:hypothetical protein